MSLDIPGIHPETLIDKLAAGSLTEAERELLERHLQGCTVCRFEVMVRADFADEASELEAGFEELPITPPAPGARHTPTPQPVTQRASRSRRAVTLAAAAIALASGAAALVGVVPAATDGQSNAALTSGAQRTQRVAAQRPALKAPPEPTQEPTAGGELDAAKRERSLSARPSHTATVAPHRKRASKPVKLEPAARVEEPSAVLSASELFSEANRARRSSELSRATELYRKLQREYPGSEEALLSQVTLGSLQLDTGNARGALHAFNRYLRHSGPLEAEALYGRARALGQLGQQAEEIRAWQTLLARHPRSGYAKQARERLRALGDP